jgi:GNAT superfamily N-acetyltransferase
MFQSSDIRLRRLTRADIPAGMRLKDLAGWNQTAGDWERFLRATPDGCFVAESGGNVCGTVTTIIYEGKLAWIGMLLVDPEYRGRGIGTELLRQALHFLDARGISAVKLDATPQGKPVYEKLEFVSEYEIERWELHRGVSSSSMVESPMPHFRIRSAASRQGDGESLRPPVAPPDLEAALRVDREIFGADRGPLLRSLHEASPDFTWIGSTRQASAAYAFGRRGSSADHLGPWIGRDEARARSALREFLGRSKCERVFVDCMKSSPFARELVRTEGFQFSRLLTRMYRGPNAHPGRPEFICAILGPEFG